MSKKIDREKEYLCKFRDERLYFIHMHCMVVADTCGRDDETALRRKMGTANQLMSLYDRIKNNGGYVYGRFLDYIKGLDKEALKYIEWTEIKE